MIIASLKINVPSEKHTYALQTVRSILGWTCAQPGCMSMEFYQDTNSPDILMLSEEWKDWASLENHIRSDTYRSILELMELSSKQPEIKFYSATDIKGMELIEDLRIQQQGVK